MVDEIWSIHRSQPQPSLPHRYSYIYLLESRTSCLENRCTSIDRPNNSYTYISAHRTKKRGHLNPQIHIKEINIHLPSKRKIKDHFGRTQARSTSAATNKQAISPKNSRSTSRQRGKLDQRPLSSPRNCSSRLPTFCTIGKRSSTCNYIA